MATTPVIDFRPRNVGELLDLTFSLYRHNFLRLIGITLVVMGPVLALSLLSSTGSLVQYLTTLSSVASGVRGGATPGVAALISLAVAFCAGGLTLVIGVFIPWMEGALTHNTIEHILGRQHNWRASYTAVRRSWGSLWAGNAIRTIAITAALIPFVMGLYGVLFSLLFAVGMASESSIANANDTSLLFLGLIAICLPVALLGGGLAIFLEASWCMVTPTIIGEGVDAATSLGRSNTLASGYRIRLIGRLLLFEVMRFFVLTLPILAIELFALGSSVTAKGAGDSTALSILAIIGASILGSVENVLVAPFFNIYITVNYLDLRVRKENLALQIRAANMAPDIVVDAAETAPPPADVGGSPPMLAIKPELSSPIIDTPELAAIVSEATQTEPAPISETPSSDSTPTIAATAFGESPTPAQRISALFKRLRSESDNPELMNQLGVAYQEVGDLFGAQDAFTRARALAPGDPAYALSMALLQRQRRDMPAARQSMADYLRLETDGVKRQKALDDPSLKDLLDNRSE